MKKEKINNRAMNTSESRNKFYLSLFLLIIIPAVLYFKVIDFNFSTYDDTAIITNNYAIISDIKNIPLAFTVDAFFTHHTSFYRPLQIVSFMADAQISGEKPWAYHLTNLILHILTGVVFFILLIKLNIKRGTALFFALLYSVHPLLTSAVCWIPARGDLLLTLSGLLSFIAFINYFNNKRIIYLFIHFICFLFACFSKETALIIPFLLMVYFYLILRENMKWKELVPFWIIWLSSFLIYLIPREISITGENPTSFSGIAAFIKNLPTIPITFGKIFIPFGLTTMPLFNGSSILVGVILIIIFSYILIKNKIYKNPYIILGVLWFLAFTLPPLYYRLREAEFTTEYLEHRTILPLIGILIMLGTICSTLLNKWLSKGVSKIFVLLIIIYAIISYIYCNDYSGPITFFSSAIASNPNNAAAYNSRGIEYISEGDIEKAAADFDRAIEIYPSFSSPYFNKGLISHAEHDYNKAEYSFSQALRYDTLVPGVTYLRSTIIYNLTGEQIILKKYDEAISLLRKGVNQFPGNSNLFYNLGLAYYYTGKYDSAKSEYNKAILSDAKPFIYYINRGRAEIQLSQFEDALTDLNKAVELKPDFGDAYFYRGMAFMNLSKFNDAISDFSIALGYNPRSGRAYYYRGVSFSKINKMKEAKDNFERAESIGYKDTLSQINNRYLLR
ncbi:MAG: tetratricopeptide repeat protein [Ignavibacteriaceae bacterium]|nr:tetratricopeptide repeat protein [Ignavibacteriaceae bacterium]